MSDVTAYTLSDGLPTSRAAFLNSPPHVHTSKEMRFFLKEKGIRLSDATLSLLPLHRLLYCVISESEATKTRQSLLLGRALLKWTLEITAEG